MLPSPGSDFHSHLWAEAWLSIFQEKRGHLGQGLCHYSFVLSQGVG